MQIKLVLKSPFLPGGRRKESCQSNKIQSLLVSDIVRSEFKRIQGEFFWNTSPHFQEHKPTLMHTSLLYWSLGTPRFSPPGAQIVPGAPVKLFTCAVPNSTWGIGLLCFWILNPIWGFILLLSVMKMRMMRHEVSWGQSNYFVAFSHLLHPFPSSPAGWPSPVTSMPPVLHSLGLRKHKPSSLLTKPNSCK